MARDQKYLHFTGRYNLKIYNHINTISEVKRKYSKYTSAEITFQGCGNNRDRVWNRGKIELRGWC